MSLDDFKALSPNLHWDAYLLLISFDSRVDAQLISFFLLKVSFGSECLH